MKWYKMRKYEAYYDDGHDYGYFEFYSYHRANSKANKEDARREARNRYGLSRSEQIEIVSTYLIKDE